MASLAVAARCIARRATSEKDLQKGLGLAVLLFTSQAMSEFDSQ
jgi:hypothetical protein